MTAYATVESAVAILKAGAYDYLAKPFALGQLEVVLRRIRDRIALETENRALARQVSERPPTVSARDVMDRCEAIETRLATIERLLRDRARATGRGRQPDRARAAVSGNRPARIPGRRQHLGHHVGRACL